MTEMIRLVPRLQTIVLQASANATAAATRVERKLTVLFPMRLRRSSVAPKRLSAKVPAIPAHRQTTNAVHPNPAASARIAPITTAAPHPAAVPATVTAPSVPGGTRVQRVTSRGVDPTACPTSLETVSAAASASAAPSAKKKRTSFISTSASAQIAATPRFAITCAAVLPLRASAVPRLCFRAYPKRVAAQVRTKTVHSPANPAQLAPASRTKHTMPPAIAPDRVTPRTAHPKAAKASVTTANRPILARPIVIAAAKIVVKLFIINRLADASKLGLYSRTHEPRV
jgi:hypothetical protein